MVRDDRLRLPRSLTAISRRAMLTRGGAFATGAGAAILGGAVVGAAYHGDSDDGGQSAETAFNVRHFGAAGDGTTDDTDSLRKAISAAREHGGVVFFPPGTYLTRRLTMYSGVHLRGSGGDATTLRLHPGANSAILESDGFATLTGTGHNGGITMFSVRDLALDGNKAHNPKAGYGLRVYGYGYELTEVVAFDCRNDGIYSEWAPIGALPAPSHQMESRLTAIRSHDNGGDGIRFNGPHDSMFLNCVSSQNAGAGFRLDGDSAGTSMVNCHGWGIDQNVSFELAAPTIGCMNCYADISGGVGVRISRSDCRWLGGLVIGGNQAPPIREIGIQLLAAQQTPEPAGVVIDTKIMNCGTAAIDFAADRGASNIRAVVSQPGATTGGGATIAGTGLGWLGKPHPTTQVEITGGLGNTAQDLVVRPAFDLRAQPTPPAPDPATVRVFSRTNGGRTELCALFPNGVVHVLAAEA
ncbi:glycoside hydrolase family 55 protein [Rugosimonospora africana]|uniref:Rhamnogalacturonase A/B/Epimerase-like pectate lyase domain-containing protein n=1 Tax=Rugosimonospora africana TaxID=556532 RepID=A0A8J3QN62_9ACTN|nr:glycoside hydrolase family 55 protein [Rugosimonospora africana]GIH14088.1 hypothetical protein Raf01_22600 [Rugosimonospora africana]